MELSVIIVNYNVKYFLEQCLESLFQALGSTCESEVIVVDNASADGSQEYIESRIHDPRLKWIANTENVGFSRANNQALAVATGAYILYLNPDTVITPEALGKCAYAFSGNRNMAVVGVRMVTADGSFLPESIRGFPDPFTSFCKITKLYRLFPGIRRFNRYYLSELDSRKMYLQSEVKVLPGAYMFASKKALDALEEKGFDERFFMYGEDIDLTVRLSRQGHVGYIPEPILHYKGESTNHDSPRYIQVFYEAMNLFQEKYYPRNRLMNGFLRLGIRLAASFASVRRRFSLFPAQPGKPGFVLYGSEATNLRMQEILTRNGFGPDDFSVAERVAPYLLRESAHLHRKYRKNYYIFDVTLYSYTTILRQMSDWPYSDSEVVFYSPRRNLLLLPSGNCYR